MDDKFKKGDNVWFDAGTGYPIPGEVFDVSAKNNSVAVRSTLDDEGQISTVFDSRRIWPRPSDELDVEDIIQLKDDSEAALLWTLKRRYESKRFYTFTGGILLFTNPYEKLDIYDTPTTEQYRNRALGALPAHLYAIGNDAYAQMIGSNADQAIIFGGESGSGKTESFRQLVRFISIVGAQNVANSTNTTTQKLVGANLVLQSFGNARTMKNNNASRFGKQLDLHFKQGRLCGAAFKTFLLELNRVTNQNPGERNFHIFYEMLSGIRPELKKKFGLIAPQNYFYLNQGKCLEIVGQSDTMNFANLEDAWETLGFSQDQRHTVYRILAAILHLGNIYFKPKKVGVADSEREVAELGSEAEVQWTAYLLQLDPEALKKLLMFREIDVKGEKTEVQNDLGQALDLRDSLAKGLYKQLFEWVVSRINHIFFKADKDSTILLLDMFGFEKFHNNGFEQFCINLANERLHNFFVQTLFKNEQAQYKQDKIDWEESIGAHLDNNRAIELLVKRPHGIICLLDDECKFPKGSDESFLQKCHLNHLDKHVYGKPRNRDKPEFCVRHYAGPAWYSVGGFMDKNRESIPMNLANLLVESKNVTLSHMFQAVQEKSKKLKTGFVASSFNESLNVLLDKLASHKCHFVRCIRPNQEKASDKLDMQLVMSQIKALGLADTAKIRRKGFPIRYTFKEFVGRYRSLVAKEELADKNDKEICYLILSRQGHSFSEQYQIGTHKIFLKESLCEHLARLHESVAGEAALVIQKNVKTHLERKRYTKMRSAAVKLQSQVRGWNARNRYAKIKTDMYRDAEQQAKHSRRLEVYEELQKNRDGFEEKTESPETSRVTAATEYLDLPDELTAILRQTDVQANFDENVRKTTTAYEECKVNHALPHDLIEHPFANYAQGNFKGHTWQMRREPIATPFLAKDSEEDYQDSLKIFELILRFMNDSTLRGMHENLVASYLVQKGLTKPALRDEIYVQLVNQTYKNSNTANAERGWLLLGLCASAFAPTDSLFKYLLNYVNAQANGYKSLLTSRLLHGVYCSSGSRMYPPCQLEFLALKNKARMVIPVTFADGKTAAAQVEPWCNGMDFAERALRQRGLGDSMGWTVSVENDDLQVQLAGSDFVMDGFSHVELPTQFPAARPDYVAIPKRPGAHIDRYKPDLSSRSSSSGDSVPSEPRNTRSSPNPMNAMSSSTLNRRYLANQQQQQQASQPQQRPAPNPEAARPPPQPRFVQPGVRLGSVPPSPAPPEAIISANGQVYFQRQPMIHAYRPAPSTTVDGRSVASMSTYDQRSVSAVPGQVPDAVMPGGYYRAGSSISDFPPPPESIRTESIYGRMGQPMSGISAGGVSMGRRPPPSEYSAMSFGSRIRRMPVPSKNSDVDKFLDDIFQPVLQHDCTLEDVYDNKSLAASVKGGGEEPNVAASNPAAQQPFQPMMYPQQMVMMMPVDSRMFTGMQQGNMGGDGSQQQTMQMGSMAPMQYPMASGGMSFMPVQFPSFMPTPMMSTGMMQPSSMQLMQQQNGQMLTTSTNQVPSPPTLPPEPSYPAPLPPTPPPHGTLETMDQRADTIRIANVKWPPGSREAPIEIQHMETSHTIAPAAVHEEEPGFYVAKMRSTNHSARYVPDDSQMSHQIRDALHDQSFSRTQNGTMDDRQEINISSSTAEVEARPGKLPNYRPLDEQKQLEQEALARLHNRSRDLPPPVDEVHFWRPKPPPHKVIQPEETREQNSMSATVEMLQKEPESVPPPQQVPDEIPPEIQQRYNEWVDESEVVREPQVLRRMRQVTTEPQQRQSMQPPAEYQMGFYKSEVEFSPTELHSTMQDPQNRKSYQDMPSPRTATKERKKTPNALSYAKMPWKVNIRKEIFFPYEEIDDIQELDLIFCQIVADCFDPPPFRIRKHERESVIHILRTYQIHPDTVASVDISPTIKRSVVDTARQWPIYFSRLFPVVEDRNSEFVSLLLAVSESGVRLVTRNYDSRDEPLVILDHFDFDDVDRVDVPERRVFWLVTRRGLQVRLFSDKAQEIKTLIEQYLYGPEQGKQFVRAMSDYITHEPNLLSFNKGDIIQVLFNKSKLPLDEEDEQSGKSWLYGKLNNRYGNFPADYTEPIGQTHATFVSAHDQEIDAAGFGMDEQWISTTNGSTLPSHANGTMKGKLTMMEFALMYFRHSPQKYEMVRNEDGTLKGTIKNQDKKSKGKEWTWRDIADQVKFTKDPITHSLLRLESNESDKMAIDAFHCIMRYMGDYPLKKGQALTDCVYELLMICHRNPPMRDEIYCQIIRQTTNNKSSRPDSAIKGWRLFSMLTAYFDCSDVLKPYLVKYLTDAAGDTRRAYHGTALVCLQNTKKTFKYGGRKFLLSAKEIEAISLGKNLKRQIYHLPGGHKKVINTKSVTVVEEVIRDLCQELNIRSSLEQQEFCLCYILEAENAMKLLSNDEYVLDVTTELEHKQKDYFLLLKRTAWMHPVRLDNDLYTDVMFFQLVPDYLEGLLIVMRSPDSVSAALMDDMAKLAALLHFSDEDSRPQSVNARSVAQLLPRIVHHLRHVSLEQWAERVNRKINQMPESLTCREARARFLEVLQSWPLFGSTFFYIANVTDPRVQGECLLAVNRHGVQFLHIITHETLLEFRLSEVLSTHKVTAAPSTGGQQMQFLDLKVGNLLQQRVITLQTEQGTEISRLLGQYIYVDSQNRGFIAGETSPTANGV